jgi:hypothetical protein
MPPAADLLKILHPTLVQTILESDYTQRFPTRCFCSLVLHEMQRHAPSIRLDLHGPRSHEHLQSQLRCILSENSIVLDKLLGLYGDALRLHAHARMNARPLRFDTWTEIVGLLVEDVFMLARHPVFDQIDELERVQRAVEVGADDDDNRVLRDPGKRARLRGKVERGKGRLRVLKYKGRKRVFRSKGRRWDFTS